MSNKVKLYTEGMPEDYICNGCGNSWNKHLVPDTIYFVSVFEACRYHDWCYEFAQPRTEETRKQADRIFRNNMLRIVEDAGERLWYYPTWLARRRVQKYYLAVSMFGAPTFFDNK